jgi:hypothetical protein
LSWEQESNETMNGDSLMTLIAKKGVKNWFNTMKKQEGSWWQLLRCSFCRDRFSLDYFPNSFAFFLSFYTIFLILIQAKLNQLNK